MQNLGFLQSCLISICGLNIFKIEYLIHVCILLRTFFFSPNFLFFYPQKTTEQKLFPRMTIILVLFIKHGEYTPILESYFYSGAAA